MVGSKRRYLFWVAALMSLAMVAAACGGDDDGGQAITTGSPTAVETGTTASPTETAVETGGDFSMSICEPESLVPQENGETCGSQVLKSLFTPLIQFDQNGEPFNAVAASIESDDQTTWTVTLNDGWTFHDGTPVTSSSFVDAWNWAAFAPNAAGNNYFFANVVGYDELNPSEGDPTAETLSGLQVVDDLSFTVELTGPFSEFPITTGYNAFYPLPASFFEEGGRDTFNEAPVGNGPYMMDGSWEHDQFVRVTKYADYGGTPGNADNIEFRIYADLDTAYRDVQAGNLDIADVPDEQIASGREEFGDRFIESPSSSFSYLGFPLYVDAFTNADIRKAFSMAIDRQTIVDELFFSTRTPADDMVSPVVQGYRSGVCASCVFDATQAKTLFDGAGGFSGTLHLWFNSDGGHEGWMEAVSNMLTQNLGIETIEFQTLEFADYLGKLDEGIDDDAATPGVDGPFRLGWVMDYPSMQNYLEPLHGTGGSSNYTTYSNPDFDDLVAQGKSSTSQDEAIAAYQQADDLLLEDMPIIPLWFGLNQSVASERVANVFIDKFSFVDVAAVQVVG